jgi:RNA polymerase sigma factor (sigma-70 family)
MRAEVIGCSRHPPSWHGRRFFMQGETARLWVEIQALMDPFMASPGPQLLGVQRWSLRGTWAIDPEDAFQEAVLGILSRIGGFRGQPGDEFARWAGRIAGGVIRRIERRLRVERRFASRMVSLDNPAYLHEPEASGPTVEDVFEEEERRAALWSGLRSLTNTERQVVSLHHLHRLPARKVALIFGKSESWVFKLNQVSIRFPWRS